MEIYAYDPFLSAEAYGEGRCKKLSVLRLSCTQRVRLFLLHIPATAETKNSINYELLSKMPKGALLINTARKEVINDSRIDEADGRSQRLQICYRHYAGNHA